jgi:hypothetical protein
MKTLNTNAYTLVSAVFLTMLALVPAATTTAESGNPIELGFVDIHVEFGSGIVGPDIPPGIELIYRTDIRFPPRCAPHQHASIFDGIVVPQSSQAQTFDIFREYDPVDFDIIAQLLTNGCPDSFWLDMGFAGFSGSAAIAGESLETPVTPHSHILFIRMTVPPFDIIHDPENPIIIKIAPPGTDVRLAAFGFPSLEVTIYIKPGSDPNCFNNNERGVIPIAILSSSEFNATEVDPVTVQLAGLVVKVAGKSNKYLAHTEDVNGDGLIDLVVQIEDTDQVFTTGTTTATLTGNLYDGTPIEGEDDLCIVP